jgi:hypothetical protein
MPAQSAVLLRRTRRPLQHNAARARARLAPASANLAPMLADDLTRFIMIGTVVTRSAVSGVRLASLQREEASFEQLMEGNS